MPFNLGSFAPLEGLLQSDKLLQQRQYNEILKQQAQMQLQKQQQDQAALSFTGRVLPQIPQIDPQMGIPQQGIGGQPVPPPQMGGGNPGQPAGIPPGLAQQGMPQQTPPVGMLPQLASAAPFPTQANAVRGPTTPIPMQPGVKDTSAPSIEGPVPAGFPRQNLYQTPGTEQDVTISDGQIAQSYRQLDVALDQSGSKMIQAGVPGPAVQDTTKLGMNAGRQFNPMEWGRLTQKQIIDTIEKVGPNEPDAVKALTFLQLNKIMAPQEKLAAQMWAREHQNEIMNSFRQEGLIERRRMDDERIQHDRAMEARLAGGGGAGGAGLMAGKQYEYTDKDGNPQTVMLREARGKAGYVEADTGKPWSPPEGAKNFKSVTASTAGGGRAGAQLGRQVIGAAEVGVDLQNVSNMPVGTTIGPTGDVEPGKTISSALKADFARTVLTNEDEINMKIAMGGLGRELSILMQPVGGGKWSSEQLEPLIPRSGYTLGNSIMALARIRQAADNAIDGFTRSPIVGQEQKAFALEKKKEMETAIPWTVNDALSYMRRGDPKETFLDFVKKEHIGGGAERGGAAAGARPPDIQTLQQQLQPENWSKLTPEQQADVARQVEEIEKAGGARGN